MSDNTGLVVNDVTKVYPVRGSGIIRRETTYVHAVAGVSMSVGHAEAVGLVGESGCGKSSLARCIAGYDRPTTGTVLLDGEVLSSPSTAIERKSRTQVQMVFQDPRTSLNPRLSVGDAIKEPLWVHRRLRGRDADRRLLEILDMVELPGALGRRFPQELSGGQRQRIALARALACEPRVLVCDESVSSLDVSTQAEIIKLLRRLCSDLRLALLFITHDLAVARQLVDRVLVMYLGRVIESATADEFYDRPTHPYSRALLSAVPTADPVVERGRERIRLSGELPSPTDPPSGCPFHPRCPEFIGEVCTTTMPATVEVGSGHSVRCHLFDPVGATAKEKT